MNKDAERIIDLYERHARDWDADRATRPWAEKPWIDRFIQLLPRGAAVLDLGCGSGAPIARHMAESGLRITGIDASPTLISLCQERLPDHDWIVGDMRSLDLGKRFDGVLAWNSFFHLTHRDQRNMFAVFGAHARPHAFLMFNTGPDHGEATRLLQKRAAVSCQLGCRGIRRNSRPNRLRRCHSCDRRPQRRRPDSLARARVITPAQSPTIICPGSATLRC